MIKFEKEQKVFDIAGVKIGGQPGEYPTVLIGSIFYEKHSLVQDSKKGIFDRLQAETQLKALEELSDKTGNPFVLDVVGITVNALINYMDFIADATKVPFLVDGPSADIRLPAMKHACEVGLIDRAIYNSIDYNVKEEEITTLKEIGVKSSVVLAFNPQNVWPEGRLEILRGTPNKPGLLEAAAKAGIEKLLIDTAVLDVPSIGLALDAITLVKNEIGLPAGCATSNAITTWKKVKQEFSLIGYDVCTASAGVMTLTAGANFLLYGPIELANRVFPACAMADALIAYTGRRSGIKPRVSMHPLFKIFR
jgi:tetrahydromethanopterin S-methyltransferase subunit H